MNTCLGTYITILCKGVGRSLRGRVKGQEKDKRIARCVKQRQNLFRVLILLLLTILRKAVPLRKSCHGLWGISIVREPKAQKNVEEVAPAQQGLTVSGSRRVRATSTQLPHSIHTASTLHPQARIFKIFVRV